MAFCPECGTKNSDDARFCSNCGTQIEPLKNNNFSKKMDQNEPKQQSTSFQSSDYSQPSGQSSDPSFSQGQPGQSRESYPQGSSQSQYGSPSTSPQPPSYTDNQGQFAQGQGQGQYGQPQGYQQASQQSRYQQPRYQQPRRENYQMQHSYKNTAAAILLSIIPGLGIIYAGKFGRGIAFFFGTLILSSFGIGIFVYIYQFYDAYKIADENNKLVQQENQYRY